jgi:hypothetical protein
VVRTNCQAVFRIMTLCAGRHAFARVWGYRTSQRAYLLRQ